MTDLLMSMAVFLREFYALYIALVFHSRVSKLTHILDNLFPNQIDLFESTGKTIIKKTYCNPFLPFIHLNKIIKKSLNTESVHNIISN